MLKRDRDVLVRLTEKYDMRDLLGVLALTIADQANVFADLQLRDQAVEMTKKFNIVNEAVIELVKIG